MTEETVALVAIILLSLMVLIPITGVTIVMVKDEINKHSTKNV